jgi:hypothetical protein
MAFRRTACYFANGGASRFGRGSFLHNTGAEEGSRATRAVRRVNFISCRRQVPESHPARLRD